MMLLLHLPTQPPFHSTSLPSVYTPFFHLIPTRLSASSSFHALARSLARCAKFRKPLVTTVIPSHPRVRARAHRVYGEFQLSSLRGKKAQGRADSYPVNRPTVLCTPANASFDQCHRSLPPSINRRMRVQAQLTDCYRMCVDAHDHHHHHHHHHHHRRHSHSHGRSSACTPNEPASRQK
ncbi:hypothetical protein BKA80DRAFT_36654 [Phyllosticta citrichinensis]